MLLIGQIILEDHLIKRPYDFMGESFSLYVVTLPNLMVIGIMLRDK